MTRWRFWGVVALFLALNAAGWVWVRREVVRRIHPGTRPVRLVEALPKTAVDRTDRLSLVFDAPLARPDQIRQPLDQSPFRVEPAVAGTWIWAGPQRLDFVLERPLPAGREIHLRPAPDIELQTGHAIEVDGPISFRTRKLTLERCDLHSADREHLNIELAFNQPVDPETLVKSLKTVRCQHWDSAPDGEPLECTTASRVPAATMVVRVARPAKGFARITLDAGLTGHEGTLSLGEAVVRCIDVPLLAPVADLPQLREPAPVIQVVAEEVAEVPPLPESEVEIESIRSVGRPAVGPGAGSGDPRTPTPPARVTPAEKLPFRAVRAWAKDPGAAETIPVQVYFSLFFKQDQPVPRVQVSPPVEGLTVRFGTSSETEFPMLVLEGPFQSGTRYTAQIAPTLVADDGTPLEADSSVSFTVPDRDPTIEFVDGEGILSPQGNLQLDLKTVQVASLQLASSRVHANNLVPHLQGEYRVRTARPLVEKTVALDEPQKVKRRTLDLKPLFDKPTGIYRIEARANDQSWTADWATVTVTNLGLTVKRERNGVWAWVTSLTTAEPLVGIKVSALGHTNQVLGTAFTDAEGVARLPTGDHPDGPPFVVVAESGEDLSYVRMDRDGWVLDDVDQSGRAIPATYDVMLYPERGVYRPGDTIHLTGIVRDAEGKTPPPFPLSIGVTRPDGRRLSDLSVIPEASAQGMFHVDLPTAVDSQTGPYKFNVTLPGGKESLGWAQTLVEAFLPVRIEVQAEPSKKQYGPGEQPRMQIDARYLFGQPASNLPVKLTGWMQKTALKAAGNDASFVFDGESESTPRIQLFQGSKAELTGELDAEGKLAIDTPAKPGQPGLYRVDITATVTESGGRSVSKTATFALDTLGRHLGLRLPSNVLAVGRKTSLDWILRSGAGEPVAAGPLEVTLERIEYDSALRRRNGATYWTYEERPVAVSRETVNTAATSPGGAFDVLCPEYGHYRLSVRELASGARATVEFWASTGSDTSVTSALNRPERLSLVLDRGKYAPGSTARLVVTSPFAGTMLLSLETDSVIDRRVVKLRETSTTIDLPIPQSLRGSAFLSASVLRAVDPSRNKWLPHRAQGIVRIEIDHTASRLPVAIDAPSEALPGQFVTVSVTAGAAGEMKSPMVHVWAVDEGILLTTACATPEPFEHFFGRRRAGVSTRDLFGELLPDYQRPTGTSRIGGDGESDALALRRGPLPGKRFTPAIVWQKSAPAPEGRLEFDVRLPFHTGELRWMAVALDGDRYGTAHKPMTLTHPLLAEASWPRFAAPGDTFRVPVKVFSTADRPLRVRLEAGATGPAKVSPPETMLTVNPRQPALVWLDVKATGPGEVTGEVSVTASPVPGGFAVEGRDAVPAGDPRVGDRMQVLHSTSFSTFPVRNGSPLHTVTKLSRFNAGEPFVWTPPAELQPESCRSSISLSSAPTVELRPAVTELLEYPHGCVEQTSSRILALLLAKDILGDDPFEAIRVQKADAMIEAGIARLWSMQTPSGGLSYWPGDGHPYDWGTAYAAGILQEASRRGHTIDARLTGPLVEYLTKRLHESGDHRLTDNDQAQACRVLAGFQKPDLGWMTRLSERLDRLDMAGRADLADAWILAGRKDRATAVLREDILHAVVSPTVSGRLTSPAAQTARLLSVLLDLDPRHPWIPTLVERLNASGKDGRWRSTVENAAAVAALTRYAAQVKRDANFHGSVEGTEVKFTHAAPVTCKPKGSQPVTIATAGTGTIYITTTSTGLLKDESLMHYNHGLYVRRHWLDRQNKPIDPAKLKVGDLIHVAVMISTETLPEELPVREAPRESGEWDGNERWNSAVENVAIVDALPTGVEVDNPRLLTGEGGATSHLPQHTELLDDRVVLFTPVGRKPRVFWYSLRVTTAGEFALPPIQASCMYNPDLASVQNGGVRITVEK